VLYSSFLYSKEEIFGLLFGTHNGKAELIWECGGVLLCQWQQQIKAWEELSKRLPNYFYRQSTYLAKPWRSQWPATNLLSLLDL